MALQRRLESLTPLAEDLGKTKMMFNIELAWFCGIVRVNLTILYAIEYRAD